MPLLVAAPPQPVPTYGGFDYVAVDETRHRVYAAHTRSNRLLVVDALTGRIGGQVVVGPMHGLAVDSRTGDVFTGNGSDNTLSKVDPVAMKVLSSIDVPGHIDAIAYDPAQQRIYADQASGANVYVIDGATMKLLGAIVMPADDLESPSIDPDTGILYQNLANGGGFAIVDPNSMRILRVVKTPQLKDNHPLVFARGARQVIAGGVNGTISAYTPLGAYVGDAAVQPNIDQCSTGSKGNLVVCAGRGIVTMLSVRSGAAPAVLASLNTGHIGVHTVGIDESTNAVWIVWSDAQGDWVQRLNWSP